MTSIAAEMTWARVGESDFAACACAGFGAATANRRTAMANFIERSQVAADRSNDANRERPRPTPHDQSQRRMYFCPIGVSSSSLGTKLYRRRYGFRCQYMRT